MEGLPAVIPASPFEGCNVPFATCTLRERTDRVFFQGDAQSVHAGLSSSDEYGVGDRHPTRHVRISGKWKTALQIAIWNDRGEMEQKMHELLLDMMDNRDLNVVCVTKIKRKRNDRTDLRYNTKQH